MNTIQSICAVHSLSTKTCVGEVTEVALIPVNSPESAAFPPQLRLCQFHHQLELMVWGIKTFFERYPLLQQEDLLAGDRSPQKKGGCSGDWREVLTPIKEDSHLSFSLPEDLEFWLNRLAGEGSDTGYHPRPDYDHLKQACIDLGEVRLTDKQLMAVCMVFYGGVKKKRAAQAMNITSQALSDHIKAALKKIEHNLAHL